MSGPHFTISARHDTIIRFIVTAFSRLLLPRPSLLFSMPIFASAGCIDSVRVVGGGSPNNS